MLPQRSPPTDFTADHVINDDSTNPREPPLRLSRTPQPYRRLSHSLGTRANGGYLPSPAATPLASDSEYVSFRPSGRAGNGRRTPRSPSDSGTEADDEAVHYMKALPASTVRSKEHKEQIPDRNVGLSTSYASHGHGGDDLHASCAPDELVSGGGLNRNILRRCLELLSSLFISMAVLCGPSVYRMAYDVHSGNRLHHTMAHPSVLNPLVAALFCHGIVVAFVLTLHGSRRLLFRTHSDTTRHRIHSCAMPEFDPAPFIYPIFLPILVALSVCPTFPAAVLPNIILSISSIPRSLVSMRSGAGAIDVFHWILCVLPLYLSPHSAPVGILPDPQNNTTLGDFAVTSASHEQLTLLYPLHQVLTFLLGHFTTTSILPAELQLLSTSVTNLLILSSSPQSMIQATILWTLGVGLLIVCAPVFRWNITLERIPAWRLKRSDRIPKPAVPSGSGLDKDHGQEEAVPRDGNTTIHHARSSTSGRKRRRTLSATARSYLSLTVRQAEARKWAYAVYVYAVVFVLILGIARPYIGQVALSGSEPFGWAVGYLFGEIPTGRTLVWRYDLETWVKLPEPAFSRQTPSHSGWIDMARLSIGSANTRLALFAYWLGVVCVGVLTVIRLSAVVEVDTRRKVFHGMMVVILLPTTFIDPCFLSLGLTLVLAVFLLLDIFRATQLRPISKPLAHFLTPYVDGRDLKGPVVVSPMFLLIGCAIPLWLSLSALDRTGPSPWAGWEVQTRDVSMVAGVTCVGMGDAAASLIGRRHGRHKWPWRGGKSIEGSVAFAAAVTVGLFAGRAWLDFGGWQRLYDDDGEEPWFGVLGRMVMAASGASFTEAVLTGCNDNVVVPVILWLLVRGLRI